jgi:hypothetical protein
VGDCGKKGEARIILEKMGYSCCLIYFPRTTDCDPPHIAIGIKGQKSQNFKNTGHAYWEMTNYFPMSEISDFVKKWTKQADSLNLELKLSDSSKLRPQIYVPYNGSESY